MSSLRFYGHRPPGLLDEEDLPGRFIVIEGTDGVGRSTQVALLKEWLEAQGYAVVDSGLRRSGLAGEGIEAAKRGNTLDARTLELLYATDLWDRIERSIIPALRAGMVALVDRYVFSLIARARVRGVSDAWLDSLYGFALVPDKVIYLDIDVPTLVPRVIEKAGFDYWESGQDHLRGGLYETYVEHQAALVEEFRALATEHGFTTVDARRGVAEVFADLRREAEEVVASMRVLA